MVAGGSGGDGVGWRGGGVCSLHAMQTLQQTKCETDGV